MPEDGQNTFPKWDLTLFVNTSISNASPAQGAPILQTIGQNSTDGHFVFPGPQANGPLPPLGPFTLGDAGQISELTLDVITARLDFITRANSVRVSSFWVSLALHISGRNELITSRIVALHSLHTLSVPYRSPPAMVQVLLLLAALAACLISLWDRSIRREI